VFKRSKARQTRIFFAADIHGSEPTFRKFLRTPEFYGVDTLVFGGDLMGKALVPIVKEGDTFRAHFQGTDHEFGSDGLSQFAASLELTGFYWKVLEPDEYARVRADPLVQRGLFHDLAAERLESWLELAEERLAPTGTPLYITGGNDDEPSLLETLDRHDGEYVIPCEGKVVDLDVDHTMITVGLSTPTPWDTPREASEKEIAAAIEASVASVSDVSRCVFNLHCPPKDTPIDSCLKLEVRPGELPKPMREAGRFVTTGGGSSAVRSAIERYQPIVGLHGHIHESGGRFRIGRTPCFNPGSEYVQGTLQGWIVSLADGRIASYQHTSG